MKIKNYKKDVYLSLAGFVLPAIVGLYAVPNLLRGLGGDSFGVLTLVWGIVGLSSIFDLGVGRSLTYLIGAKERRQYSVGEIYGSGLFIVMTASIVCAFLLGIAARVVANAFNANGISEDVMMLTVIWCAVGIIPTALNSVVRGAAEGIGNYYLSMVNRLAIGIAMFVVPLLVQRFYGGDVALMALGIVLSRFLILFHAYVATDINIKMPSIIVIYEIYKYGSWVTVSNIVGPLMMYSDRFFISFIMGVDYVQFYAIPQEAMQRLLLVPGAISNSVVSKLASIQKKENWILSAESILRSGKYIFAFVVFLFFLVSKYFFVWWIGEEFWDSAVSIVYILLVGIYFNGVAQYYCSFLSSINMTRQIAIVHTIEFPFYITFLYIGLTEYGIHGAAAVWSLRVVVDYLLLRNLYVKYVFK